MYGVFGVLHTWLCGEVTRTDRSFATLRAREFFMYPFSREPQWLLRSGLYGSAHSPHVRECAPIQAANPCMCLLSSMAAWPRGHSSDLREMRMHVLAFLNGRVATSTEIEISSVGYLLEAESETPEVYSVYKRSKR